MAKIEPKTIGEALYWFYANLGMAHKAVNDGVENYKQLHYIIRSKLYHGLIKGTIDIRSLFHDEKSKLYADKCCVYCGNADKLSIDHIISRKRGGKDTGENLVIACKKCNSSKSDTDLLTWYLRKNQFPPLHILRNYLKMVILYCREKDVMKCDLDTSCNLDLPCSIEHIPFTYPKPNMLFKRHVFILKSVLIFCIGLMFAVSAFGQNPDSVKYAGKTVRLVCSVSRAHVLANPPLSIVKVNSKPGKEARVLMADLKWIKSEWIENIEIFKGNEAISKYGDEAKNGVILITLDADSFKTKKELRNLKFRRI